VAFSGRAGGERRRPRRHPPPRPPPPLFGVSPPPPPLAQPHNLNNTNTTTNHQIICHGIPDARELQDGDIVNVDVTAYLGGFHGDLNETFTVGTVDEAGRTLVRAAHDALAKAIEAVRPGVRFRDVGDIISKHVHQLGLSVVKTYCGHGIGDLFHCAPSIPHYTHNKAVGVMKEGQVRGGEREGARVRVFRSRGEKTDRPIGRPTDRSTDRSIDRRLGRHLPPSSPENSTRLLRLPDAPHSHTPMPPPLQHRYPPPPRPSNRSSRSSR
jgi:hypothetical protein